MKCIEAATKLQELLLLTKAVSSHAQIVDIGIQQSIVAKLEVHINKL